MTTLRILVVEDSASDAALVIRHLERAGRDVQWERVDGREALLTRLQPDRWEVVLCDFDMPGFGGAQALQLVRQSGLDLPFIFVSGAMGEEVAVEAMRAGAHDYVVKGNLTRLLPAIERELREAQVRRQRRREDAERQRLVTAVEQTGELICITDVRGTIQYVNPAFERTSGWSAAEVVGQSTRLLNSGRQDRAFYERLWSTILRGEVWREYMTNRRKDGTLYDVAATISPLHDAAGEIVNFVSVQRDVTRERQLEEQLRQSQKMEAVGRLAGGVAHDFNNLLTVIFGYAELALEGLRPGDPLRRRLENIHAAAKRAETLTRQLLAFSRKQVLKPEVLKLDGVVAGLLAMLGRLLGEDIQVAQDHAPDLGPIKADRGQLEQVVMNLAVNARDAMPGGGTLTLETRDVTLDDEYVTRHLDARPGPHVLLAVTDTGCGMDEQTLARLFEPFFTTKAPGKGTGLGLSTVYGIVRQSEGHVTVESQPGEGTTFRLYFPRDLSPAEPPAASPSLLPGPAGSETVLVAEDDDGLRALIEAFLASAGYRPLMAANGGEALMRCEQHAGKIDLLLTDVVMPHMGGQALAARLASVRPDLKVLYMSGYTNSAITPANGALGPGVQFIHKPFTRDALTRKVREALEAPAVLAPPTEQGPGVPPVRPESSTCDRALTEGRGARRLEEPVQKRILVPLDGSTSAELIVEQVRRLLVARDQEVVLLTAVADGHDAVAVARARDELAAVRAALVGRGATARCEVLVGDAAERIVERAAQLRPELVVMATHGRSGVSRVLHGSVAEAVLRRCAAPLLLANPRALEALRAQEGGLRLDRILVPLDGSDDALDVLPLVEGLARRHASEVLLLTSDETSTSRPALLRSGDRVRATLEPVRRRLAARGIEARALAGLGPAAAEIIDVAERERVDVVAMSTHGRSGVARWVQGSVAEQVLRHGARPVLVRRARRGCSQGTACACSRRS